MAGFQLQSHYNGYSLRQLSAVVDALAEFHATGTAIITADDDDGTQNTELQSPDN